MFKVVTKTTSWNISEELDWHISVRFDVHSYICTKNMFLKLFEFCAKDLRMNKLSVEMNQHLYRSATAHNCLTAIFLRTFAKDGNIVSLPNGDLNICNKYHCFSLQTSIFLHRNEK